MKVYVVYYSKTGFTKQYAEWITSSLGAELVLYEKLKETKIEPDDIVIFGSRIHVGKVQYFDEVKKHLANHKNLIVFGVGGTPVEATEMVNSIWTSCLTEEERNSIPHFYMQGGLKYESMGFAERLMMKAFAKILKGQAEKNPKEAGMAEALQSSFDAASKDSIKPLIEYVNKNYK